MIRLPIAIFDVGVAGALARGTLLRTVGRGLFVTVSVLYLTRSVGLDPVAVGTALTVSASAGLGAGLVAGRLADLWGARRLTVVSGALEGMALLGYVLVHSVASLVVVAALVSLFEASNLTSRSALVASSVPPKDRVRTRARLRVVTNLGWALGAGIAGAVLIHESTTGYLTLICCAAGCFLSSALVTLGVPAPATLQVGESRNGPVWVALRDWPFIRLTLLNAVLSLHDALLNIALPLWVSRSTRAPVSLVAWLFIVNTVVVVLLQVRLSRESGTALGAARAQRRAGLLLWGSCAMFASSSASGTAVAVAVLVMASVGHAVAEIFQSAGAWGIAYDLADERAIGQYQGVYGTGSSLAAVVAPALLTGLVVGLGTWGWLLLGTCFAAAGLAVPRAARRARQYRAVVAETIVES